MVLLKTTTIEKKKKTDYYGKFHFTFKGKVQWHESNRNYF